MASSKSKATAPPPSPPGSKKQPPFKLLLRAFCSKAANLSGQVNAPPEAFFFGALVSFWLPAGPIPLMSGKGMRPGKRNGALLLLLFPTTRIPLLI
jgi:hypothetical protein